MENPIIDAKKELIEWIGKIDDLNTIQELFDLKNKDNQYELVAETKPEYAVKDDFDERFAKGMSGEELIKRVYAHIESLPWKEK